MKKMSIKTIRLIAILCLIVFAQAPPTTIVMGSDQMSDSNILGRLRGLETQTDQQRMTLLQDDRQNLHQIQEVLLSKLESENEDVKCYAVYLLGEYRFPQAVNSLVKIIGLRAKIRSHFPEALWDLYPAMEALIKIGNPSIPAVIRNLAENDDVEVRGLSLKVIYYIEKDNDIVQLRLQKALAAEKNPQKQARLHSALKTLAEASFGK